MVNNESSSFGNIRRESDLKDAYERFVDQAKSRREHRAGPLGKTATSHERAGTQEQLNRPALLLEVYSDEAEDWTLAGRIVAGGHPTSISDNHQGGRDIYVCGVDPDSNTAYIKKSLFGMDESTTRTRVVNSTGYEPVAILHPDDFYEITVMTDRSPQPRKLRFTYTDPNRQPS